MFGNLIDDIDLAAGAGSGSNAAPMSVDSGTARAAAPGAALEAKHRKPQQPQQQPQDDSLPEMPQAPDLSSADEDYRRKKKRRQQNSKRLPPPDPRLMENKLQAAEAETPLEMSAGHDSVKIKPLHAFFVDHPHLADDTKSKGERCIGVAEEDKLKAAAAAATATMAAGSSASTDVKDAAPVGMDTASDGKQQQQQQPQTFSEDILKEPEEFALLREAMQRIPNIRWLFSDAMLRQQVKPEECMQYLHEKRARLPESRAQHENLLVAEAGMFISTAPGAQPGKMYTFPACVCNEKCVGVTEPVAGLPNNSKGRVLTKYMNAVELAEFLRSGTSPAGDRMCRDCYVATIALMVYNVRGYSMHEPSSNATHALAQQQFLGGEGKNGNHSNRTSFGADTDLHRKCNASLVRMADTLCLNPFTNLCNQEGGYIADCMLLADGKTYEGVLGNVVRFRASYRRWQFNEVEQRWYMSQEAMIWHPPETASDFEIDVGDPVHHF